MSKKEVKLIVSFEIKDYELFETVAKECAEYIGANEAGTLAYDWFLSDDKSSGKLLEVYESPEALEAHLSGSAFREISPKFKRSIKWLSIESFGPLPELYGKTLGVLPNTNWVNPQISAKQP